MKTDRQYFRIFSWLLLFVALYFAYDLSLRVTQPDFGELITSAPKAKQILNGLLRPELLVHEMKVYTIGQDFPVPCGSAALPTPDASGPRLEIEPACADTLQPVKIKGVGLEKDAQVAIRWRLADGRTLTIRRLSTDENGNFELDIKTKEIITTVDGIPPSIEAEIKLPGGPLVASETLIDVTNDIIITIFMALLATTLGTLVAIPISFLAAGNITRRGIMGSTVYFIARSIFNIVRSFEPLVMATIFALIVGFGSPFAGVLAMSFVTFASMGKLFSEAIESISPGPIEAITATGGNRAQVILYGVVPQIVPDFLSFALYHWDINVRISTIIGFVGGGGIGYYLSERIKDFHYNQAGAAILAIVIVVWVLDFLSSQTRKQLI